MAPRKQLAHKAWDYLDPPYDTFVSAITPHDEPYIVSGSNVLTSRRGIVERRPGSSTYESSATNFNDGRRIFVFRRTSGQTYIIHNEVTATQSKVSALLVGIETAFTVIYTGSSPTPYDFVVSSDTLYFSNGNDAKQWDGTTVRNWGISMDSSASTTAGPNNPTTATADGTKAPAWTNPGNVTASDDVYATQLFSGQGNGDGLRITGFAFNISGTVTGVKVEVEASASQIGAISFYEVYLLRGGSTVGSNKGGAFVASPDAYTTFGGTGDLWSVPWTDSDINASTFGVFLRFDSESASPTTLSVDHVRITVYYTGSSAPTTATSGTGITAAIGWKYVYCYKSSATGHISSPSPVSASTGPVANKTVTVTGPRSTDAQVDKVRLFRSLDGEDGPYYFISETANPGSGTWSIADTTADTSLSLGLSSQAPLDGYNDPPTPMFGMKAYANRVWGFNGNVLYYSGWEEINVGNEEECFGPTNFFVAPFEITNLAVLPDALLVITRGAIFKVTGDSRSTFSFLPLFWGFGSAVGKSRGCIEDGDRVFWMNMDNRMWVTDGENKDVVSEAVTDDLLNIAPEDCAMAVHHYGEAHWLIVADANGDTTGAGGAKWYVLDLLTGKWMPPWTISATSLVSGETSSGQFLLLYCSFDGAASNQTVVRVLDIAPRTTTYADGATPYTANAVFGLTQIAPPGFVAEFEYIGHERDETGSPTAPTIRAKNDEDNDAVSWASEPALTQVDPTLRTAGSTLIEKWAYFKTKGKRALVRFEWTNENKNFRLLSLDLAHRLIGGED